MAKSDLEEEVDDPNSYSFIELQEAFYSLLEEYKNNSSNNKLLKKQLSYMKIELDTLAYNSNAIKKELE